MNNSCFGAVVCIIFAILKFTAMSRYKLVVTVVISMMYVTFVRGAPDTLRHPSSDFVLLATDYHHIGMLHGCSAAAPFLPYSQVTTTFENRFLLKELMREEIGAVFRYKNHAFLFNVSHFGYSLYGEMNLSAGYARTFGQHFSVGLNLHYLMTHAESASTLHSLTFDVSFYGRINRKFGMAFSCYNPARLKYGLTGKSYLPVRFLFELSYIISDQLLIYTEIEKELKTAFDFSAGAVWRLRCLFLSLSAGFPNPWVKCGVEIQQKRFLFGVNCQYRLTTGVVPQAELAILF